MKYHVIRGLAITLAACLWAYQTGLLIRQAGGIEQMPWLDIFGTVTLTATLAAALPLAEFCVRNRAWIKGIALLALFAILASGILPQIIARSGEVRDTKIAQAVASGEGKKMLEEELARSRTRLDQAEAEATRESRNGGCKTTCQNWQTRAKEIQARIDKLTGELVQPAAQAPSDTSRIATLLNIDPVVYDRYQPFLLPIGMEIGIWFLGWVGFTPVRVKAVDNSTSKALAAEQPPRALVVHPRPAIEAPQPVPAAEEEVSPALEETPSSIPERSLFIEEDAEPQPEEVTPPQPTGKRVRVSKKDLRLAKVFSFAHAYKARHGEWPSTGKIAGQFNIAPSTASGYRKQLLADEVA